VFSRELDIVRELDRLGLVTLLTKMLNEARNAIDAAVTGGPSQTGF
jgi:hypothetical protein